MKRRRVWREPRFWLGMAFSLALLWLVTRRVSWSQLLAVLQTVDWKLILAGSLLLVVTWVLFAVRWRLLLSPVPIRLSDAFSYILIGYLINGVFPLRLGDVGRIILVGQKYETNVGFTSASLVVERLFDVLTMVALAGLLMLITPVPELIRRGVQASAIATFVLVAVLVLLSRAQNALARLRSLAVAYLPRKIAGPLLGILGKFVQGLQVLASPGPLLGVGLLSALSWAFAGAAILCFVHAFRLEVPWYAALLVLAATNLGGAIPSSPGSIGVYEFLAVMALSVWFVEPSTALGFAAVTHVVSLALGVTLGLMAAWREGVRLSGLASEDLVATQVDAETI